MKAKMRKKLVAMVAVVFSVGLIYWILIPVALYFVDVYNAKQTAKVYAGKWIFRPYKEESPLGGIEGELTRKDGRGRLVSKPILIRPDHANYEDFMALIESANARGRGNFQIEFEIVDENSGNPTSASSYVRLKQPSSQYMRSEPFRDPASLSFE